MHSKILWVDEDYYALKGIIRPLSSLEYEIMVAESFEEAKAILDKEGDFSLILLDLILPYALTYSKGEKINDDNLKPWKLGEELFYYIRAEKHYTGPILLLTIVNQSNIAELMKVEQTYYIHKRGLLPQDLKNKVLSILNVV
jgi:CheY-like chemotaxis protein